MPQIKFRKMRLDENIEIIKWAFFEENASINIYKYTVKYFKELNDIDKEKLSRNEIYKIIEKVVAKYYFEHEGEIEKEIERYSKVWNKYNDEYFTILCQFLNITWPSDKQIIDVNVGLIPTFPRYLDTFSFSVSTNLDDSKIVEVCAHESLHFAWFEKWMELYPECPREEFDSPYLPWQYSEMVTDSILNSNKFKELFNNLFEEKAYDAFYLLEDGNDKVMDIIKNIYNEDIKIEEKIKKGYEYLIDYYKKI